MFDSLKRNTLMKILRRKSPKMALAASYGTDAIELVRELIANTPEAEARRASVADLSNAAVGQIFALGLIAKQIKASGAKTWETVPWDDILPLASLPFPKSLITGPLDKLSGELGTESEIMETLMKIASDVDIMDVVLDIMDRKDDQVQNPGSAIASKETRQNKDRGSRFSFR